MCRRRAVWPSHVATAIDYPAASAWPPPPLVFAFPPHTHAGPGSRRQWRSRASAGSSEADELYKICSVMGTPSKQTWGEGLKLASNMGFRFPHFSVVPLSKVVPAASPEAIELMTALCSWCGTLRRDVARTLACL